MKTFSTRISAIAAAFAAVLMFSPSAFAQSKQLSLADILIALRSKKAMMPEKNRILAEAVKARGITFALTDDIEKELGNTGAEPGLIDAIKSRMPAVAKAEVKPPVVEPVKPAPPPPPDYDFYKSRAEKAIATNELDAAILDLTKALELKPNAAAAYLQRGELLAKQNKHESAVADFDKSIQYDEKSAAAFVGRAVSREKLRNVDGAMGDYRRAIDLDPKNEVANSAFNRLMAEKAAAEAKTKPAEPVKEVKTEAAVQAPPTTADRIISLGALNAYAIKLEAPVYTPQLRRMGFQGKVTVLVSLDEKGEVSSATATEGPKPLRGIAEDAVKRSKFKPALMDGKAVQSSGYITYNFVANQ